MNERFDSWQGFADAGFMTSDDGSLCLGNEVASYSVAKVSGGIHVKFTADASGYEDIEFALPLEFDDMWEWAAQIASRTFGSRRRWDDFRANLHGQMDPDLEQMINIGIDHLDEVATEAADSDVSEGNADPDTEGSDEEDAQGNAELNGGNAAMGCGWASHLRKIVKMALDTEWQQLSDWAQAQDIARSQAVMNRVNRLKSMDEKIVALAEEWKSLGLADKIGKSGLTFKPVVQPKPKKPITPEPKGPMGFAVTFEDGVRIAEAKASVTFAKVIEKIGAARVAALGLRMADDPLVTQDRVEIKKMPMMVHAIADGWFVKTHSNTYTKMEFLRRIGEALNVVMKFETFRREPIEMRVRKRGRGRPPKLQRKQEAFQIGRVVKWAFPRVFKNGNVTDEEIALFLSEESKRKFGTRGHPVLKASNGNDDDYIVNGQRRYYADVRLEFAGRVYLLTSQFITANAEPILSWLETKGFSREDMYRIGRGEKPVPSLFPEMTTFESDAIREAPQPEVKVDRIARQSFEFVSDAPQPTLFDQIRKEDSISTPVPSGGVQRNLGR